MSAQTTRSVPSQLQNLQRSEAVPHASPGVWERVAQPPHALVPAASHTGFWDASQTTVPEFPQAAQASPGVSVEALQPPQPFAEAATQVVASGPVQATWSHSPSPHASPGFCASVEHPPQRLSDGPLHTTFPALSHSQTAALSQAEHEAPTAPS